MTKREVDLGISVLEKFRWNLREKACKEIEEELRKRKAQRGNHENHNGASSSSSWCITNIDLNKYRSNLRDIARKEIEEELRKREAERVNHENRNGASSSSSSSGRIINIDLNEPPSESEREESQSPNRCSFSLVSDRRSPNNPPNPDCKPSPSSKERPLVRKRRSSGGNKKAKKRRPDESSPPPTPAWLVHVMESMDEAEDARLILKKTLFKSDVKRAQSRFLITFKQLKRNDFLTQDEWRFLEQDKVDKGKGMDAVIVNQRSEKWNLHFKLCVMEKNSESGSLNYLLNRGWNAIVEGNALKAGDKIDLWSFRSQGSLCFALGKE